MLSSFIVDLAKSNNFIDSLCKQMNYIILFFEIPFVFILQRLFSPYVRVI